MLSTHSRLHGSSSYRVPWAYDEESVDVVRFFAQLKCSLMPYLYRNAVETSRTGIPMVRSMVLEFTEDKNCAYLANQYMLGDGLLVAPIFNEDSMAEYYLPEGTWTNYLTGEEREGGKWYREKQGYLSIPLYVKEGSIVAEGAHNENAVYDYADGVTFRVYRVKDGQELSAVVYDGEAREAASVKVQRTGDTCKVIVTNDRPCTVRLMNVTEPASVAGGTFMKEYHMNNKDLVLTFKGSGEAVVKF